jgi:hypothetical protein
MDDEMTSLENRKDTLLPEACEWIINDDKYDNFLKWNEGKNCQVLWVKGEAGMGKTMLVIGLIRELKGRCNRRFDMQCLSYFFCQGTDNQLNTATAIIKGLMWMLLCQERRLCRVLNQEIDRSGDSFLTDSNAFPTLARVFTNMVCDTVLERAVLVVDGLDECKDFKTSQPQAGLESLLELIVATVKETDKVKWLVSSRNIDIINEALLDKDQTDDEQQRQSGDGGQLEGEQSSDLARTRKYKCLEVNRKSMERALKSYIDAKVKSLGAKYLRKPKDNATRIEQNAFEKQSKTLDRVAKEIRDKTDGTFLWVALVFQELKDCEPSNMLGRLEEIPSELKKLYARIIQRISRSMYKDSYKKVITVSVLAFRPLHVAELMMLANATRLDNDENFLENSGLLTVRNDIAYLLHQSTLDYLKDRPDDVIRSLFPEGYSEGNLQIVKKSLKAMAVDLADESLKLEDPSTYISQFPNPVQYKVIQYSCVYWIDHLCILSEEQRTSKLYDEVYNFLKSHLLDWLLALCLVRSLAKDLESIKKLSILLQVCL